MACGMFQAEWWFQTVMEPIDAPFESTDEGDPSAEVTPDAWVPNLSERRETLRLANEAIERARELLERIKRIESPPRSRSED